MTNNFKVFLAPNATIAQEAMAEYRFDVSVEAEYGDVVVEGAYLTLAHHTGEWRKNPAPCEYINEDMGTYTSALVSHLDLDTVGGLMAAEGVKPSSINAICFWKAAGFIDTRGPHHLYQLPSEDQSLLKAFWKFSSEQERTRYEGLTEVTETYNRYKNFLIQLLTNADFAWDAIQAGADWYKQQQEEVESRLVSETLSVRTFVTDGPFCNAAYYSPNLGQVVPAVVSLNTKTGSVTLSFAAGAGSIISAKDIVQKLWGPEAGGHHGIAGSPRGQVMTRDDLRDCVNAVLDALTVTA